VDADALMTRFVDAADAARAAIGTLSLEDRRSRTDRRGQYALDLVADAAILPIMHDGDELAVVSEESGRTGRAGAPVTVVLDPVDGSTNCSRGIPYWAISLCAIDVDGLLCALVRNQVTGATTTAIRGEGARRDGDLIVPSAAKKLAAGTVIGVVTAPTHDVGWFRALGSAALALCDVAAGVLDAYYDAGDYLAPWDYLGGVLACIESGAQVVDAQGRDLATADPDARRQVLAAGTPALLEDVQRAARP
jgi:myo-inositol-1(or 4)-monophosphatase